MSVSQTTVKYSKIVIPCSKCGHGCEISLGYLEKDNDGTSSSLSESEVEDRPPAKKAKLTAVAPSPESSASDSSDSDSSDDSGSDAPVPTAPPARPTKRIDPNSRAAESESSSSDSDSSSDSSSSSSSSSDSSSESSSSSDSSVAGLPKPLEDSSVQQFFNQFPSFTYDSSQTVMSEYFRMSRTQDFKSLSTDAKKKARQELKDALAKDFGQLYGDKIDDLGAWQSLCRVLRFKDVPDDLEGCQLLVTATYVNIVDLIDTVSTGNPVQHFESEKALSQYTLDTGNTISKNSPHVGSLLKFLLRKILEPSDATRDNPEPLRGLKGKRKRRA